MLDFIPIWVLVAVYVTVGHIILAVLSRGSDTYAYTATEWIMSVIFVWVWPVYLLLIMPSEWYHDRKRRRRFRDSQRGEGVDDV